MAEKLLNNTITFCSIIAQSLLLEKLIIKKDFFNLWEICKFIISYNYAIFCSKLARGQLILGLLFYFNTF